MVVTALEGGIDYWACLDAKGEDYVEVPNGEAVSETAARLLLDGKSIGLIAKEENVRYELTLKKLLNGFKKWFEDGNDFYGIVTSDGLDMLEFDASCADGIIQIAVLGEIIYS